MTTPLTPDDQLVAWMTDIRRSIHQYPELSLQEFRTADFVSGKLAELAISHKKGIAGTGIAAFIGEKRNDSKIVALRADMDALPITEKTGLPFSSQNPGVMHACGHDGHMAMLLGAAALLKRQAQLPGQIVLLFQPAEEDDGGAEKMIAAGALEGVNAIFGGHIERHYAVGEISVQPGIICAFTDEFKIIIRGPGGHAAKPHESIDCIVAASSVVTVGKINGGTASNVIADQVVLEGTIRTTHPEARGKIFESLRRMVLALQDLYKADTELQLTAGYPPVINDPIISEVARKAALQTVGENGLKSQPYPSLGGEDFSFFLKHVPGCFVRFGARLDDRPNANAHSPTFDFDERVLPIGAEYLARCAILFLQQASQH